MSRIYRSLQWLYSESLIVNRLGKALYFSEVWNNLHGWINIRTSSHGGVQMYSPPWIFTPSLKPLIFQKKVVMCTFFCEVARRKWKNAYTFWLSNSVRHINCYCDMEKVGANAYFLVWCWFYLSQIKSGLCPAVIEWFFIVHTQYHRHHCTLHSFEQFGTLYMHTSMTNIRPGQDSNSVHLSFKPRPGQMNHFGRPENSWSLISTGGGGMYVNKYFFSFSVLYHSIWDRCCSTCSAILSNNW